MFKEGDLVIVSDHVYDIVKERMEHGMGYEDLEDIDESELSMTGYQAKQVMGKAIMEVECIDGDGDVVMVGKPHMYWAPSWLQLAKDEIEGEDF